MRPEEGAREWWWRRREARLAVVAKKRKAKSEWERGRVRPREGESEKGDDGERKKNAEGRRKEKKGELRVVDTT